MLSYLKGQVKFLQKDGAVVVIDNLGYEVFMPAPAVERLKVGQEVEIFTHEYIRESARELFGFLTRQEHALFDDLMRVSGVGPRMGLHVLSLGAERVRDAISRGDAGLLSTVSGVGKKTAQKIVLELKGILVESSDDSSQSSEEVIGALKRLGYSQREASEALQSVGEAETTEDKIKSALKVLGKR
ncbi:Holliday junction branch migration protein RuvA [Candidatus Uhrbacteria bacterium]|nr:Holliday junction branch migration protein RuvA [Candidatus Uhrbacteria bacterium]